MSFTIRLAQDVVSVEAGSGTPLAVTVTARGDRVERYELDVEGIDPEWRALPVPTFDVEPGETHTERIFIKPPRTSETVAGDYPFVVSIRSLETGEQKSAQCVLQIKQFHHIGAELAPRRGVVSGTHKSTTFVLTLVNLGNAAHTLQLYGSDPDNACIFEFETAEVRLTPGQQREVEVEVMPQARKFIASSRLIGFSVVAKSLEVATVHATAQAQLEVRAVMSFGTILVFALIVLALLGWYLTMPHPPKISIAANPMQVEVGSPVRLHWEASGATEVQIQVGGSTLYEGPNSKGALTVEIDDPKQGTIEAIASKNGVETTQLLQLTVLESPDPVIQSFDISPRKVKLGQPVTLRFRFNDAVTKAVLSPLGQKLDPQLGALVITPDSAGVTQYQLIAYNKDGRFTKSKSIGVYAYDASDAAIIALTANPAVVQQGDDSVTISWQVANSVRVELQQESLPAQAVDATGTITVPITAPTYFILTAFDSKGRTMTKKIFVAYKKTVTPAPTIPPIGTPPTSGSSPPATPPTTTAGSTGGG